jgi:hypothetical protein
VKKTLLVLVAGSLLVGGWLLWAVAAGSAKPPKDLKPVVIVSLSGYDKTLDNLALLGRASGNPELARELILVLKLVAIQEGLSGPNKTRPWGIAVQADGDALTGCAFLPSGDLAKLAELMEPLLGKAESVGGGIYRIRSNAKPVYVKQNDGWAYFAYSPEDLDASPADPMALLDGLNSQYDAAIRVHATNLLPKQREQILQWIGGSVDSCATQGSCEPGRIYALRKQLTDETIRPMIAAASDLETLTVGWTLDTDAQKTSVELRATAREGSDAARRLAGVFGAKGQFGGFRLPEAALSANWTLQFPPLKSTTPDAIVEAFRELAVADERIETSNNLAQSAKKLVADVATMILANAHDGRVDGGMALLLKPDAVTVLTGGYVADTAQLTETVKQTAAALTEREPRAADWIKLDAGQCRSVRLHTLSIPIPPEAQARQRVVALIGDRLELAIGVGPQSAYAAIGRDPLGAIKRVIEPPATGSPQNVPAVEFSLAVGTAAKFIAGTSRNDRARAFAAILAASLEPSAGRDHVKFVATSIPHGLKCRIEAEEGILKLIGRLRGSALDEQQK